MIMEDLNKETFEKALKEEKVVIVDFWAPYCGPCKMLTPILEELSKDYEGRVKFAKVNTEDNSELAGEYKVMSIPCLIVFKEGKELERLVGMQPKEELKKKIDSLLLA